MKTILMDINLLPEGFDKTIEGAQKFGNVYQIRVIPFDSSPRNVKGGCTSTGSIIVL